MKKGLLAVVALGLLTVAGVISSVQVADFSPGPGPMGVSKVASFDPGPGPMSISKG